MTRESITLTIGLDNVETPALKQHMPMYYNVLVEKSYRRVQAIMRLVYGFFSNGSHRLFTHVKWGLC